MYRAYIYDDMERFTDVDFRRVLRLVTPERRERAMAYVHAGDRRQSVAAELLLRHALRDAFAIAELPETAAEAHGKPEFADASLPRFNLSHCAAAVACAVSDEAVGIDVEPYSSWNEDVAREVFSEEELVGALASPARFAELWTMKESYLKYTGEGLRDGLKELLADTGDAVFHTFHFPAGYACTVCTRAKNHQPPTIVDKTTLTDG